MEKYLEGLNKQQLEGATTTKGRIRIVAGAGAGKTKTLTCRYAYLMEHEGVSPDNILCLTFTNKAANEMRVRIEKMIGKDFASDFICTIHSFCVKVLRRDIYRIGFPKFFNILDEEDKKSIASDIIEEMGLSKKDTTAKSVIAEIDALKAKKHDTYIKDYFLPGALLKKRRMMINPAPQEVRFYKYCENQLKNFALDFNDLITFALYLLITFDDVRAYWQDKFHYIMVDEAQDCNKHDWMILELLSNKYKNLYIIGDDNQSIYGFRGSDVHGFINFKNDKTIILNQNYRSTKHILDVANSIIKNNKDRVDKDLFTEKKNGTIVNHFHGAYLQEEGYFIADEIKSLMKQEHYHYSDFTILYRINAMSRDIEQTFIRNGIPYKIYGGIRFYERKEIKDAISFLKLVELDDNLSFKRIINEPSRGLGKAFVEKVSKYADKHKLTLYAALKEMLKNKEIKSESAEEFVSIIDKAKLTKDIKKPSDTLNQVLTETGYRSMLVNDLDEDRLENLAELMNSIKQYEKKYKEEENKTELLSKFLQDIALFTNTDDDDSGDVVKLMTMHQSKGLEFPVVFVYNAFEGGIPCYRACKEETSEGIEEERRLMYVACTRAKNRLYITESDGYNYMTHENNIPSRFINEITPSLISKISRKKRGYNDW